MSSKKTPKPRKPSGFDAIADQAITALVQMLGDEQRDLELAANAILARRAAGNGSKADVERIQNRISSHRAALENVGRIVGERKKNRPSR